MTKTVRKQPGRMFQFNHRDLDESFEGETKQTTKKLCMTKTILWHKSNRFLGRRRFVRAAFTCLPRILTK